MASILGSNRRKQEAQARIEAVLPRLIERYCLDLGPMPQYRRDPHREAADRAAWTADVLEALDRETAAVQDDVTATLNTITTMEARIAELELQVEAPNAPPEPGPDPVQETQALMAMTRPELDAYAVSRGLMDAHDLKTKQDVVDALLAQEPEAGATGVAQDS